ncbi:unnamed protein product [Amoebophrya sp. A120]|nr:unnamed protein product [Amoebophrya sp. A120]|eukprot:GSA120T00010663001.1
MNVPMMDDDNPSASLLRQVTPSRYAQYYFPHDNTRTIRNGFFHGILYGTRIRVVDALVKTWLFASENKVLTPAFFINTITNAAFDHGSSLGLNVALAKTWLFLLRRITPGNFERPWHWFVSGFLSGGIVWGSKSGFHDLMNMYIMSRVLVAFVKRCAGSSNSKNVLLFKTTSFQRTVIRRLWAAVCWGTVLYQYHMKYPLTNSLYESMQYLYKDSRMRKKDTWRDNLGSHADWFPLVAALVWFFKAFPLHDAARALVSGTTTTKLGGGGTTAAGAPNVPAESTATSLLSGADRGLSSSSPDDLSRISIAEKHAISAQEYERRKNVLQSAIKESSSSSLSSGVWSSGEDDLEGGVGETLRRRSITKDIHDPHMSFMIENM